MSTVEQDGGIHVEGEYVGHMKGLRFVPDGDASGPHAKALKSASLQAVAQEIRARAQAIAAATDPDITMTRDGTVIWQQSPIARLEPGDEAMRPRIHIIADEQLNGPDRESVALRLDRWQRRHIASVLEPLVQLAEAEDITGIARGIAFRLVEALGILPREDVAEEVKSLGQEERAKLRKYGVRFGAFHIFIPALLKPAATELRLLLWMMAEERQGHLERANVPPPPGQGLTSTAFDRSTPKGFYRTVGYRICGPRVVRIDMLERLGDLVRDRVFWKPRFPEEPRPAGSVDGGGFTVIPDMMSLVGCSGEEFAAILRSLGFRMDRRPAPVAAPAPEGAPAPEDTSAETVDAAAVEAPVTAPVDVSSTEPAAPEAEAEPKMLEVWWPKDTGPFRARRPEGSQGQRPQRHRRKPAPGEGEAGQADQQAQRGKSRGRERGKDQPRRPPREDRPAREKPIDKDSPFAVLGALKAQLQSKP